MSENSAVSCLELRIGRELFSVIYLGKDRVEKLFDVAVNVSEERPSQKECPVTIQGRTKRHAEQAQEYVKAMCSPEYVLREKFQESLLAEHFTGLQCQLERSYSVICAHKTNFVEIRGSEQNVKAAFMELQRMLEQGVSTSSIEPVLQRGTACSGPSEEEVIADCVKIGYSESIVKAHISRIGPRPSFNDVMTLLIQGNSSMTQPNSRVERTATPPSSLPLATPTLRPIIIDGSNVAMSHGNGTTFSCKGIKIVVQWFLDRGHSDVIVIVPANRKEKIGPTPITDQHILKELEKSGNLTFSPIRKLYNGPTIVPYDDLVIVEAAHKKRAVIVSNDNYRDVAKEHPEWRDTISSCLIVYTWVGDMFMPSKDPLGRGGPSLEDLLHNPGMSVGAGESGNGPCKFGKRCTKGPNCKYDHPERETGNKNGLEPGQRSKVKDCPHGPKCRFKHKCTMNHPPDTKWEESSNPSQCTPPDPLHSGPSSIPYTQTTVPPVVPRAPGGRLPPTASPSYHPPLYYSVAPPYPQGMVQNNLYPVTSPVPAHSVQYPNGVGSTRQSWYSGTDVRHLISEVQAVIPQMSPQVIQYVLQRHPNLGDSDLDLIIQLCQKYLK